MVYFKDLTSLEYHAQKIFSAGCLFSLALACVFVLVAPPSSTFGTIAIILTYTIGAFLVVGGVLGFIGGILNLLLLKLLSLIPVLTSMVVYVVAAFGAALSNPSSGRGLQVASLISFTFFILIYGLDLLKRWKLQTHPALDTANKV